jgi:hypothetical protein
VLEECRAEVQRRRLGLLQQLHASRLEFVGPNRGLAPTNAGRQSGNGHRQPFAEGSQHIVKNCHR